MNPSDEVPALDVSWLDFAFEIAQEKRYSPTQQHPTNEVSTMAHLFDYHWEENIKRILDETEPSNNGTGEEKPTITDNVMQSQQQTATVRKTPGVIGQERKLALSLERPFQASGTVEDNQQASAFGSAMALDVGQQGLSMYPYLYPNGYNIPSAIHEMNYAVLTLLQLQQQAAHFMLQAGMAPLQPHEMNIADAPDAKMDMEAYFSGNEHITPNSSEHPQLGVNWESPSDRINGPAPVSSQQDAPQRSPRKNFKEATAATIQHGPGEILPNDDASWPTLKSSFEPRRDTWSGPSANKSALRMFRKKHRMK